MMSYNEDEKSEHTKEEDMKVQSNSIKDVYINPSVDTDLVHSSDSLDNEELIEAPPNDELMLTTTDNPYSPKVDYPKWRQWDIENGYNTEQFLARLLDADSNVDVDDELTLSYLTADVVQDILEQDVLGIYSLI